MKALITGAAGFIGSALSLRLLDRGDSVIAIDNHNDNYEPAIKEVRLSRHANHPPPCALIWVTARRLKITLPPTSRNRLDLAAQVGVRYSIKNLLAYIDSNIVGLARILEGCRHNSV